MSFVLTTYVGKWCLYRQKRFLPDLRIWVNWEPEGAIDTPDMDVGRVVTEISNTADNFCRATTLQVVAPEVTTPARRVVAAAAEEVLHRLQPPEAQRVPAREAQPEAEPWISSGQRQEEQEIATLCR